MKDLSLIRLASYAICLAAFLTSSHQERLIEVSLWGLESSDALHDRELAGKAAAMIPNRPGFLLTRMSGSQVLAAALAAAKAEEGAIKGFGEPHVMLTQRAGRLIWIVSFYQVGGPPGAFFGIGIDDETATAEISPGL
jgi:hypothetical protein